MASLSNVPALAEVSGQGLTVEESAALQVGMQRRKAEEGLMHVLYWGKVTGTDNDYLVVVGYLPGKGAPRKKFFFATTNNLVLQAFPDLTEEFAGKAGALNGRFKGDPSLLLDGDEEDEDKGDEDDEEGVVRPPKFSEMHRLAYVVNQIDNDCSVVPRGSCLIDASLFVRPNKAFSGLSYADAGSLDNYQHLVPSKKADLDSASTGINATDFLDRLSDDEPKGVWALRVNPASGAATIRSLKWLGYFFLHQSGTPLFTATYNGDGRANADLGFML